MSTSRLDLAALDPVLTGEMRLLLSASRASDIIAVIDFAKKERLKVAIIGAEEGWLVAKELAAAKIPVIVEPLANLPESFEAKNARTDNATLLAQAGVKVAIATRSSHLASNLRFTLGNAVRAGLPHELALRAATLTPAEVYGVEKLYGSIEGGKIADVVVWTGDPFEPSSYAETVIIRGELQPVESRQTRLAQKYIRRYELAR
jgi:imidazolonepropionase-like amidohydrolase